MRANEFVLEGPGDWMQGQVLRRKQIDQKKAQKANVPKIAKLVQQNLAAKVGALLKNNNKGQPTTADALADLATKVLSKTLKVNVDSDPYNNALDLIKTQIASNPTNIAGNTQITSGITDIVNTSLSDNNDKEVSAFGTQHAEVYDLPATAGDRDMVYTNNNNEWSLWQKSGRNRIEFLNKIEPEELTAVKELIRSTKTRPTLLAFTQIQGNHYKTSAAEPT